MQGAEARCQTPVLPFDVVNNTTTRPGQKGRNDEANALARTGRCKAKHMLRSIVPKVMATESTKNDAVRPHELRRADLRCCSPTRRAVGRGRPRLACPPDRHRERDDH